MYEYISRTSKKNITITSENNHNYFTDVDILTRYRIECSQYRILAMNIINTAYLFKKNLRKKYLTLGNLSLYIVPQAKHICRLEMSFYV